MLRSKIISFISLLLLSLGTSRCTTEDVYPTVQLQSSKTVLEADGGVITIKAVLNGPVVKDLNLPLQFRGSAVLNRDYSSSSSQIVILANSSEGSITLSGINTGDTALKFIEVSLGQIEKIINTSPSTLRIELANCTADRDNDSVSDCVDDCPDLAGPVGNNGCPWLGFLVNEVLYDPPSDISGDANGDGTRDPLADEFVEFYNSNPTLDISGYTLSDATSVRHVFPAGTILPSKGVLVVFGGGNPTGSFGNALVQTASSGELNLSNAGDVLTMRDAANNTVVVFDINGLSSNPDESYTRNPDLTGAFVQHASVPAANGAFFSPGKKLNGLPF